jgi:hypothetical protein
METSRSEEHTASIFRVQVSETEEAVNDVGGRVPDMLVTCG